VEATPWEVARAFTPFLEKGKLVEPRAWGQVPTPVQVFSPEAVTMALGPLSELVQRGTAAGFAARCGAPLAGKTGTTDNRRDSWFVALRPRLLTVVWVGTDRNRETGLYGASGAGLLWQEIDLRLPRAYKEGRWE
jgi:penicillin-binding protein 1B